MAAAASFNPSVPPHQLHDWKLSPGNEAPTASPPLVSAEVRATAATKIEHLFNEQDEPISRDVIYHLLQGCTKEKDLVAGRQLHSIMISNGLETVAALGDHLIRLFASSGSVQEATLVFCKLKKPSTHSWHAIISAHVRGGEEARALELYHSMQQGGIQPNKFIFSSILKACSTIGALEQGKLIHDQIIPSGLEADVVVGTALIDMYAKCGCLEQARNIFDRLPDRDAVVWDAMIAGYTRNGHNRSALQLFEKMQKEDIRSDKVTFSCILKACGSVQDIRKGKLMHEEIVKRGLELEIVIGSTLIDMYAKCGSLEDAATVFDKLPGRNAMSWGAMIAGHVEQGFSVAALELFEQMQQEGITPDNFTFSFALKACSCIGAIELGNLIHSQLIKSGLESDKVLGNTLVDMYAKCGILEEARKIFDELPSRDVVCWSAMISGYSQHGNALLALELFKDMQQEGIKPDNVTFSCVLKVCGNIGDIVQGKLIHEQIKQSGLESDVVVGTALVDMYAKSGSLEEACEVFHGLPNRNVVLWNAMIGGYIQHGHSLAALEQYQKMQHEGLKPDKATFLCILKACGSIGAIEQGKLLHDEIMKSELKSDVMIGNTIVDMYAKCGSMAEAHRVFDGLCNPSVVSWGALIAGYAQHGSSRIAQQLFDDMQQQGLKPDGTIYTCILKACSHAGQVEEGQLYYKQMREDNELTFGIEHYNCMVDLLARAGHMSEAEELLETMPFLPDICGWMSLLTACRSNGNVQLGRRCFDRVVQLDPNDASSFILMSNIYADAGIWEGVDSIQALRRCAGAWKKPGKAWIEVENKVHEFTAGDKSHTLSNDIYAKLESLSVLVKNEGYVPQLELVLKPLSNKYKEKALWGHCEKLAIAFGLLTTPEGTTIRVTKNLRVCTDCHNASKIISKIERRPIIINDSYCVHHFEDGVCSCGNDS